MVKAYENSFDEVNFDELLVDGKLVANEDRAAAGKEIKGKRIAVYWAKTMVKDKKDAGWWNGTVMQFQKRTQKHEIQFDDDDSDDERGLEDLSVVHWELIETPVPEKPGQRKSFDAWRQTYYSDKQKEVRRQVARTAWANRKAAAFLNEQKREAERVSCLPILDFPTRVPPNLLCTPISWPSQSDCAPQSLGPPNLIGHPNLLALPNPFSLPQQQAEDANRHANATGTNARRANATGTNATSASTSLIVATDTTEESSAGELAASQSLRPPNPLFFDSPNRPSSPHSLFVSCRPKLALASIGKDARKDGTYAEQVQAVCR